MIVFDIFRVQGAHELAHVSPQAVLDHLRESGIPVDGREAEDIVLKSIDPEQIMLSYESEGGTGPRAVAAIVAEIEDELAR